MFSPARRLVILAGFTLMSQTVFAHDVINTYKNGYGSLLKLSTASDNRIHGTFTTAVASANCQKVIGVERPIIGYQVNKVVSFIVTYPECGSLVSFTGHMNADNEIEMTALVTRQPIDQGKKEFNEQMVNHAVFKPVKQA